MMIVWCPVNVILNCTSSGKEVWTWDELKVLGF